MSIYTRKGDTGKTCLYGGKEYPKHNLRVEAYGTIDELNAMIGAALSTVPPDLDISLDAPELLGTIQRDLFDIGSHLATPYEENEAPASLPKIRTEAVEWMEKTIDQIDTDLPELKTFIIPGGTDTGSLIHVARTICRRAERRVTELADSVYVDPYIIKYLNRLSDFLFTLARLLNQAGDQPEVTWKPA